MQDGYINDLPARADGCQYLSNYNIASYRKTRTEQDISEINGRADMVTQNTAENFLEKSSESTCETGIKASVFAKLRANTQLCMDERLYGLINHGKIGGKDF